MFVNLKTGGQYRALCIATDCTNERDKLPVVIYTADSFAATVLGSIISMFGVQIYVRDMREFAQKFKYVM